MEKNWRELIGSKWVEIDADTLDGNVLAVRTLLNPGVKIMAVVKADAYGLGAVETSRILLRGGVEWLGVTTLEELLELREAGISAQVLILSPLLPGEMGKALEAGASLSLAYEEAIQYLKNAAARLGVKARVHLKVDTGLGRTGFHPLRAVQVAREIVSCPEMEIEGVFTHFSNPHSRDAIRTQFERFKTVLEELQGIGVDIPLKHAANSEAALSYPWTQLNMVRLGTALYGQRAAGGNWRDLKDPWRAKARILQIRPVSRGSRVGYGGDFIARRNTKVAVISLGYADGLNISPVLKPKSFLDLLRMVVKSILAFFSRGYALTVKVKGHEIPVVGRVGMQLSMLDIDGLAVEIGDEVEVPLRRTAANPRLPRVYLKDRVPYLLRFSDGTLGSPAALKAPQ